jgi:hypothetical protein
MENTTHPFDNSFGSLDDVSVGSIPDNVQAEGNTAAQSISMNQFKSMAMEMAKNMKPEHMSNLRDKIASMPIDMSTVKMMLQMNQLSPLRMLLTGRHLDPNFENAVQITMQWAETATATAQIQVAHLVLSLPAASYHQAANDMLVDAKAMKKKQKSSKSQRNRQRKEALRRQRMQKTRK